MECIGLRSYAFDQEYDETKIESGKKIIEAYRNDKLLLLGNRKSGPKKKVLPDIEKYCIYSNPYRPLNQRKKSAESLDESQDLMFSTGN